MTTSANTLNRALGYWDLVVYGLAYIAPMGIFSTLGFVWTESRGLIALAYLLGGICMYFTAGLATVALGHGFGNGAMTLRPFYEPGHFETGAIFSATSLCVMSFLGFDAISTLSEEVKGHDRRLVGRAIITVLLISAIFFILLAWVFGNALPGIKIQDPAAAYLDLAQAAIGPWAASVIAWAVVVVIGFSNALPMQVGVARVLFAMGRDRQLPYILARVHATYRTPYVGMLAAAGISLGIALAMRNLVDELASIVNFGALSGFLLLHISVLAKFALGQRSKNWIAHWLVPVAGIAVVLAVFTGMSRLATELGISWLVIGGVYGLVLRARHRAELAAEL